MIRRVVLVAVAGAQAASLVMCARLLGPWSPWLGVMIMVNVLGLIGLASPLFLLRMPKLLGEVRRWETKSVYGAFRVPQFGVLLRRTPLRHLNASVYLTRLHDPAAVMAQAESAEAAHLLGTTLLIPHIAYACIHGRWGAVLGLVIVQLVFNVYPILHLRWTRARLTHLRTRLAAHRV